MQQVVRVAKLLAGRVFICAMLALFSHNATAATDSDVYRLKSEVAQLRSQVRILEQQVRQLGAQMRQARDRQPIVPAAIIATSPWHQLRLGMSKSQVSILLGESTDQEAGAGVDVWHYTQRGHVEFDAAGRVSRWKTP